MRLKDFFQYCVRHGMAEDPRTIREVRKKLSSARAECRKLSVRGKKFFDKERLSNPYDDTRLLFGNPDTQVRRVLVGIDIGVGEVVLAKMLSQGRRPIDLILAHHPLGQGLVGLPRVMDVQTQQLIDLGVQGPIARDLMKERVIEVDRHVHSANHDRSVDAARLCGIPLICCHTPADNHVASYLQKKMDTHRPKTLKDVIALLLQEPEYRLAAEGQAGPRIILGEPRAKAGKVVIDMTGGTEGSKEIFARLSQAGVQTMVGMHMSDEHFQKAKSEHMNVIIAGHIASDNVGLNLLLDKLAAKQKDLTFVECSGFRRVRR